MNKTQKVVLYSLGGLAALAGTYYYFRQRKLNSSSYNYLLNQFKRDFFKIDILKLANMQFKFEQLFIKATMDESGQTIIERLQYKGNKSEEEMLKIDCCSQHLKSGAAYYECLDCSIVRQEIAKSNKKSEEQCIYLTVCEDCFDIQKHKGHNYTRHQASNEEIFRCCCGDSAFMKKESFCNKHLGYQDLVKVFDEEEKKDPRLWQQIESFFQDFFHIAFDTASILLYNTVMGQQNKTKSIQAHLNTFLGFIFDKINEIIELNKCSMVFFTRLFQKTLSKPIALQLERKQMSTEFYRWRLTILKQSQLNTDLSILDYIMVFSKLTDSKIDQNIANLLRNLIKVEEYFRCYFSERFFKFIFFTFKSEKIFIQQLNKEVFKAILPPLAHMMIEQVSLMSVFIHLVEKLGEEIFTPLDLFNEYLETKPPQVLENDEVIYLLFNICFEMLKQINMLKIILPKFYKLIIDKYFIISYRMFIRNSISFKKEPNKSDFFISNIDQVCESIHMQILEPQVLLCFINIYEGILLMEDENLVKEIIPYICQAFSKITLTAYLKLNELYEKDICFISLSLSFVIQLPLLIALSERKMFSKSVVQDFFEKNFKYSIRVEETDSQQEAEKKRKENKEVLITSILAILNSFITINTQTSFFQEMKIAQRKLNLNSYDGQRLNSIIAYTIDYIISPQYRIYDFFTLSYQLISLAVKDEILHSNVMLYHKHIAFFKATKQSPQLIFLSADAQQNTTQMFIDSTPFINVFFNNLELFFPEFRQKDLQNIKDKKEANNEIDQADKQEEKENKEDIKIKEINIFDKVNDFEVYKQNMHQIIITIIQAREREKMFIKDIELFCKSCLHYPSNLLKYAQEVCKTKDNEKLTESDDIILLQQYETQYFPKNFLRVYEDIYKAIQVLQSKNELTIYPYIGTNNDLQGFFQYQIDLIERILMNPNYQQKLIEQITQDSQYHHISFFFSIVIYFTLKFLKSYKNSENLNEETSNNYKEILEMYKNEETIKGLKKQIEEELNLSKKRLTDTSEKQILKAFLDMLDYINDVQKIE
ncbi:eukaryotic aspartyl protease family protein (macronuclear) [Tetrahymena thermophila SB210]|uniref:Eukaryotic aspartyl protease family protein n=1 Tax=Tetrahymena thermophila (strain SB210) TaxID=312017 RepID=I7MIM4_TETTS|nr:eukaryotic aspartyl protease family protein [Tetrahymena thermophila SB210]EAR93846.2 eukaryotic aspartyl protease family protein [Tetrahymena thermophila SB210]|eukprot:XP_001014091.2 eukaryotic aspartyl protease family protein [Tetrahymena thermophila SB210]